jgi:hypothetical protein
VGGRTEVVGALVTIYEYEGKAVALQGKAAVIVREFILFYSVISFYLSRCVGLLSETRKAQAANKKKSTRKFLNELSEPRGCATHQEATFSFCFSSQTRHSHTNLTPRSSDIRNTGTLRRISFDPLVSALCVATVPLV